MIKMKWWFPGSMQMFKSSYMVLIVFHKNIAKNLLGFTAVTFFS